MNQSIDPAADSDAADSWADESLVSWTEVRTWVRMLLLDRVALVWVLHGMSCRLVCSFVCALDFAWVVVRLLLSLVQQMMRQCSMREAEGNDA